MTEISSTRKRGRRLAGLLAGTLALGVLPLAMPAGAQTTQLPDPQGTSRACPVTADDTTTPDVDESGTQVPEDGFADADGNTHEFSVDCAFWYEITSGQTATTYNPNGSVTRGQMATFIAQVIDYVADRSSSTTDGLADVPSGNAFPCDVDTTNIHFDNIQRLAAADVVQGTGDNAEDEACFGPNDPVSREAMATFIRQAQDVVGTPVPPPAISDNYFVDDDDSVHEVSINAIAKEGIVRGVGNNANNEPEYGPATPVSRAQMTTFLMSKVDRLIEDINEATVAPPPYATAEVDVDEPAPNSEVEVTITQVRGTVDTSSAVGCGNTTAIPNETGDPLTIVVPIDDDADDGECTITVTVNFDDEATGVFAGEDRSQTINLDVEVITPTT